MTLNQFITKLLDLEDQGHGAKQIFYRVSSSGDCGPLSSAHVSNEVNECGPFDLNDGEEYISVNAGN